MFQVSFIYNFKKCCQVEQVIFFCLGCDDRNLGRNFERGRGGMSKNAQIQCIFQEYEYHKFKRFSHTSWNMQGWEKILQVFQGQIKSKRVYRNMKGCILDANLVVINTVYICLPLFTIIFEIKEQQKKGALKQSIEVLLHTCIGVLRKFLVNPVCFFIVSQWKKRIASKISILSSLDY